MSAIFLFAVGERRVPSLAELGNRTDVALEGLAVLLQSDAEGLVVPTLPGDARAEVVWIADGVPKGTEIPKKVGVPAGGIPYADPKLGGLSHQRDTLAGTGHAKVLLEVV